MVLLCTQIIAKRLMMTTCVLRKRQMQEGQRQGQ